MKLRLRSLESKQTLRIEVPDPSTLNHLKQTLLQTLSSSFSADSLHLSLNRKDELQASSPEDSLHSLGITSGDLVFFTFKPSEFSSLGARATPIQSFQPPPLSGSSSLVSSSSLPQVKGKQLLGIDCDLKKPRLENSEPESMVPDSSGAELTTSSMIEESDCEEMEVEEEPTVVVEKKCSRPIFLRRVLKEELGYDRNAHKLLVTAVHAVLLESGFVLINPNLGFEDSPFRMPEDWPSPSFTMSLWYTLPELLTKRGKNSTMTEVVLLKFQSLGYFVNVYGSLNCSRGSSVYRVSLDERKFAPNLDLIWVDSVSNYIMDEKEGNPEKQVFEFWKIVKDALALPLLIDICEKTGLPPPASFMLLPADVKLKILEALPGVDIARVECVCTELRYLASSNELWKMKFNQEFGLEDGVSGNRVWKTKFVEYYEREKQRNRRTSNMRDAISFGRHRRPPYPFPVPHIIGGDYDIVSGIRLPVYGVPGQSLPRIPRRHAVIPHYDLRGR
ncbi:F-box protein SKIP22-like [Cucumis melo var. makuwa]|uniref:F-box protein SKIP22-like n=3 Tax=Cucumis melo TaxID=3656 RepID=A0A5D3E231_CUCMM|nr:F-box family protein [Cucumis melo subsp. melo]TYK29445.1 F-box protein SKIP22-like [Cucumis melo var. makuwa]